MRRTRRFCNTEETLVGLGAFLVSFGVMSDQFRIAFVSGKLGDVDGVSLEVDKWIDVLSRAGHDIYTIAGRYGSPVAGVREDRQLRLEKIAFDSEEQQYTERLVFPHLSRRCICLPANADLVTYLPIWEGFGNALLEAIAARVPVVVSTYLVYKTDIMPLGLRTIEVRDRYDQETGRLQIPDSVLDEIHYVLKHPAERSERVAHNFELARQEFGFHVLETKLQTVFAEYANEIRASRRRLRKSRKRYSV